MGKAYLGWGDWVKDGLATVTASSTKTGFTAASLAIEDPALFWYAADSDGAPVLKVDLGAQREVGAIEVYGVVPVGSTWRARLSTSDPNGAAGLVIDSGSVATRYDAATRIMAHVPATPQTGRYIVIDGIRSAGRVRAPRLWTPEGNYTGFSSGYEIGGEDFGSERRTDGGTLVTARGAEPRAWIIPFRQVLRDEVFSTIEDIRRTNGAKVPVSICLDRDADPIGRWTMLANMRVPPGARNQVTIYHELSIGFVEVLYDD